MYKSVTLDLIEPNTEVLTMDDSFLVVKGVIIGAEIVFDSINKTKSVKYRIQNKDTKEIYVRSHWIVGLNLENLFVSIKKSLT